MTKKVVAKILCERILILIFSYQNSKAQQYGSVVFGREDDNPNLRECYVTSVPKCHLVIVTPPVVTTTIALFH